MNKKIVYLLFAAALCGAALVSCEKEVQYDPHLGPNEGNVSGWEGVSPTLTMVSENTACIGDIPSDILKHFNNITPEINSFTRVLFVNRANAEEAKSDIQSVLRDNFGVVLYIEPVDDEVEVRGYCEQKNASYEFMRDVMNFCLANGEGDTHAEENECPEVDENIEYGDEGEIDFESKFKEQPSKYNALADWILEQLSFGVVAESDGDGLDITKYGELQNVSKTFLFSGKTRLRTIWWQDFFVEGSGSVTNSYTIYRMYAHEGQTGHGDYYMVKCNSNVASGEMYRGRWWNKKVGIYIRQTGYYLNEVTFTHTPVDANGNRFSDDVVMIPAAGSVSPTTTINQTKVTTSKSFSLNVEATAKKQNTYGKENSSQISGEASVGVNWGWSETESTDISDEDILEQSHGNVVSHKIKINNGPKYKYSEDYGFTLGCNACKSTLQLPSTWVWYWNTPKDGDTDKQFNILSGFSCEYGAMSFTTTNVNLQKFTFCPSGSILVELDQPDRTPVGLIQLENTFNDLYITDITVLDTKGNELYCDDNTYSPGEEVKLALYCGARYITFRAGRTAADAKSYELIKSPIQITKNKTINLKSGFNFQEVQ